MAYMFVTSEPISEPGESKRRSGWVNQLTVFGAQGKLYGYIGGFMEIGWGAEGWLKGGIQLNW